MLAEGQAPSGGRSNRRSAILPRLTGFEPPVICVGCGNDAKVVKVDVCCTSFILMLPRHTGTGVPRS